MKLPKITRKHRPTETEKSRPSRILSFILDTLGGLLQWGLLATLLLGLFTIYTDNQDFLKFTVDRGFLEFQDQGITCSQLGQAVLDSQNKDLLNSFYSTLDSLNKDIRGTSLSPSESDLELKNIQLRVRELEAKVLELNNQNARAFESFKECANSMLIKANTTASLLDLDQQQLCPIQNSYLTQLDKINQHAKKDLSGAGGIQSFYLGNDPRERFWTNAQNQTDSIRSQLFIYEQQLQPQAEQIDLENSYFDQMKTISLLQMRLIHHETLPMIVKSVFISDKENEAALQATLQKSLTGQPNQILGNCQKQ